MTDKPRTWTISERAGYAHVKPAHECSFADETNWQVIELEPVLDLLVRLIDTQSTTSIETWGRLYEDAEALLREHGRLK